MCDLKRAFQIERAPSLQGVRSVKPRRRGERIEQTVVPSRDRDFKLFDIDRPRSGRDGDTEVGGRLASNNSHTTRLTLYGGLFRRLIEDHLSVRLETYIMA